jgi:hypothetical protein
VLVSYVVVPKTEMVVLRVAGHHPNKRRLVEAVRSGAVEAVRVRNPSRTLWSKARVKRMEVG